MCVRAGDILDAEVPSLWLGMQSFGGTGALQYVHSVCCGHGLSPQGGRQWRIRYYDSGHLASGLFCTALRLQGTVAWSFGRQAAAWFSLQTFSAAPGNLKQVLKLFWSEGLHWVWLVLNVLEKDALATVVQFALRSSFLMVIGYDGFNCLRTYHYLGLKLYCWWAMRVKSEESHVSLIFLPVSTCITA